MHGPEGPAGRPDDEETRMRYLLLIATDPRPRMSAEEFDAMMAEYSGFGRWAEEKGWLRGGEALEDVTTATTVQVRDGRRLVTDGPFAETKEQLGGYYIVDVPSLDDAIEAAARIPGARIGSIEIRPIREVG
jgi:hypothetical protein